MHGAVLTIDNGAHGGNLDVQEVTTGNKVMFPRPPRRARTCSSATATPSRATANAVGMGAIEIAAELTVQVACSPRRRGWPGRASRRRPTICTVGCARPLEDAMRIAFEEMIYWLEDDYGIPATEAYMLLGQIAEARCTQMVNPKYTLHLQDLEGDHGRVPLGGRGCLSPNKH